MSLSFLALLSALLPPAAAMSFRDPDTLTADAQVGCRVGAAGDVNGDGHADLLVTDCQTDTVRLYTGTSSGISTSYTTLTGEGGGGFGFSLSGGGDLNGDGYSDVVIGAPEAHGTRGCVYVAYGSAGGLSNPTTPLRCGLSTGQTLGGNVDIVGDINGDGYDDLAWGPQSGTIGRLGVHHGSASGVSPIPSRTLLLNGYTSGGGEGLRGAGDVNGDGFDDVILGSPTVDNDTGSVRVYYGSVIGLTGGNVDQLDLADAWGGEWPIWFGWSVDGAGDVDSDGYDDLLVGDSSWEGSGYLIHGGPSGPVFTNGTDISYLYGVGDGWGPGFSYSVAGGGDFDADGVPDLLTAGWGYSYYLWNTWVWTGASDVEGLADWHNDGPTWSGYSVASLGDVDGDGCDDFASGFGLAPGWDASMDPTDYTWGVDVYYGGDCPAIPIYDGEFETR